MQCAQTVIGQRCWRSDPVHAFHWPAERARARYIHFRGCADLKIFSPHQSVDFDQSPQSTDVDESPQPRPQCIMPRLRLIKDTRELIQNDNYGFRSTI